VITRGSNTYGPWQYPEKVVPLFISNALAGKPLPLYGDGSQERDWLHVDDHAAGVYFAFEKGVPGEVYNVSGGFHLKNIDLTRRILAALGLASEEHRLIQPVTDRLGHDRRYAMDDSKIRALGWKPRRSFDEAFAETVRWYQDHQAWLEAIRRKSADYQDYYRRQYEGRSTGRPV
jgi:dTDP-glucose 4,6-dehydratase